MNYYTILSSFIEDEGNAYHLGFLISYENTNMLNPYQENVIYYIMLGKISR